MKDEKVIKSSLKINTNNKTSFSSLGRNNEIYIIGGKNHEKAINIFECHKYDHNNELTYNKMPSMIQARFDHSSCLGYDSHLYVLGGITPSNDSTNSVERFNWDKATW